MTAAPFRLGDCVDLPVGPDVEVDVEGLDRTDDHLWIGGAHRRTRKQAGEGDDADEALRTLTKARSHPNRHVVIRGSIADRDDDAVLMRSTSEGGPRCTAALLDGGVGGLADALSTDEHLTPFAAMSDKDNGLDVGGIAGLDDGVLLGLRGAVLRVWAVVVAAWIDAGCSMSDGALPRPMTVLPPPDRGELHPTGAVHGSGSLQ
jgi:Protein of unknown function (DUF3616)